jgi:hypothetical protein
MPRCDFGELKVFLWPCSFGKSQSEVGSCREVGELEKGDVVNDFTGTTVQNKLLLPLMFSGVVSLSLNGHSLSNLQIMARTNNQRGRRTSGGGGGGGRSSSRSRTPAKGRGGNQAGGARKRLGSNSKSPGGRGGASRPSGGRGRGAGRGGGRGGRGGRGGGGRGRPKREEKKPATAEELDAAMDDYWVKSGNKELASKKLDDDMDSYWAKKEEGDGAAEGEEKPAAEEAAGEEGA